MSELQRAIIDSYKKKFPKDKLRHISEKTSIQITRVFRILNGSEMKISEYEAFQNCLSYNESHLSLIEKLKLALSHLNETERSFFSALLDHEINNINLKKKFQARRMNNKKAIS
ncbi:MAG: hypothetical protein CME65_07175 [Halobacteriovoraceae bacterium]|nr:hypothetical protein [Halobacteriovoraceae bacterium]|tara:strand:+ start:633 stop:974 length:342 start_codon:yes stop_codon:yes gene_type:complete